MYLIRHAFLVSFVQKGRSTCPLRVLQSSSIGVILLVLLLFLTCSLPILRSYLKGKCM